MEEPLELTEEWKGAATTVTHPTAAGDAPTSFPPDGDGDRHGSTESRGGDDGSSGRGTLSKTPLTPWPLC